MNNFNTVIAKSDDDNLAELFKNELNRLVDPNYLEQLKKPYKIKVAYYLRVSTANQAQADKVSLQEQERQIKEFIVQNKWGLYKSFCDKGISGKSMESRDDFLKMIQEAREGKFDVIVAWTTDRLARNVDEMTALRADLKKYNIQITTVKEPTDVANPRSLDGRQDEGTKKIMAYLRDWTAEQDNVKRVSRFEAGKMGKARKGKIPVKVPYGYKKVITFENGDPKRKTEEDRIIEEKAVIVREIFDLYDKSSIGMLKIAAHLNLKGTNSPTGKKWGMSTIKYILQNPTYIGIVRWGWRLSASKESRTRLQQGHKGILVKGIQQKIIETDQFNRVKEKLRLRHTLGGKAVSSRGLLTGILKCGRCRGGTYFTKYPNWHTYKKPESERSGYKEIATYFCSNYAHFGKSACTKRYVVSAQKIEKIVLDKISKLAHSEEARKEFTVQMKKNNTNTLKTKLNQLNNEISRVDEKYSRVKHAYTNGTFSLEEFSEERKILEAERALVLNDIESAKINLIKEERIASQSETTLIALADFEKSWALADTNGKKELFQVLLEKVVVDSDIIQIDFNKD